MMAGAGVVLAQTPASPAKPVTPPAVAPAKRTPPALKTRTGDAKQAMPSEAARQEAANQVVAAHESWGPAMSSTIASATLQEVARDGATYTYHLYAAGMSRDRLYKIVAWPVNQVRPVEIVRGVALDAVGMAICPGQLGTCGKITAPNEAVNLNITIAPGRPVRVGIVAEDESTSAYTKLVPVPIRGVDKGCTLEAVMLTQSGAIAVIEGSGFAPNSEIDMQLVNGDQRSGGKTRVDDKGLYFATVIPVIDGVANGTMKINVTSAKCNPSLSFDWGVKPQPAAAPSAAPAPAGTKK